jgi:ethanolamine utilization microcompartment shell protein EutS
MADQSLNNAVSQNPDQNRLRRIEEAQKYHSPVEQDIREYRARAAAVNPAEKPIDTSLQDHVNAEGILEITVPVGKPAQEGKGPMDAPAGGDPKAVATAAPAGGTDPTAVPPAPPRRSVTKSGGVYVVEDRPDGPYVIARQPAPFSPIRAYDKGVKVEEEMLLPDDERNFLEKTADTAKGLAIGAGDASTGALEGIGIGQTKLVTNALRTLVDNPVGDFTLGAEKVQAFEDFTNKFLENLDKAAAKSTKTKAGKVAQTGGEIVGQFVAPTMGLYSKLKAAGANPIAASLISEGMVAIAGVNPNDQNLSDMIADDSKFKAIKDLLGTDPESSDWENRAKNAAETFALMGIGEVAGRSIIEGIKKIGDVSKGMPDNVMSLIDKSMTKKNLTVAGGTAAVGAATLTPEEAEANARTEVLQKAIALLNDVDRPAGQSVIKSGDVEKMIAAADQGVNPLTAGVDFNLTKIENAEQLGATIDEVSEIYKDKIYKGKRGVQTFDMTQTKADMSREMGFDVEAALSRQPGDLWPDYKIKAARDMFVAQVEKNPRNGSCDQSTGRQLRRRAHRFPQRDGSHGRSADADQGCADRSRPRSFTIPHDGEIPARGKGADPRDDRHIGRRTAQ